MEAIIKLVICLLSLTSFAQVAPLENHTWYLEKLVINGNDVFPPQNLNPYNDFNWNNQQDYFVVQSCSDLLGIMIYDDGNSQFTITNSSVGPGECPSVPDADMFDTTYIFEFYDFYTGHPTPFTYAFTNVSNYIVLTITSANGDQAIYRNQQLGVSSNDKLEVDLYPNPATSSFQLDINAGSNIKTVRIFSVNGKEVMYFKQPQGSYNVSQLSPGIYFVKIEGEYVKNNIKLLKI
ncbi:T9SS type A sorting domain-containing protein [uncultured Mesonia sp.]|uniref:T9SS type A sorting domain-containing protein n=1 Tax=uncultured Mesonia sp. TaxID=399731 RepID=UPI00374E6E68